VIARERDRERRSTDIDIDRQLDDDAAPDRETMNPMDRAQPGDVLGIERGGEVTSLGDTARDEDERLEDELEDAGKLRREESKDRKRR
jgi:hypothetical protein